MYKSTEHCALNEIWDVNMTIEGRREKQLCVYKWRVSIENYNMWLSQGIKEF